MAPQRFLVVAALLATLPAPVAAGTIAPSAIAEARFPQPVPAGQLVGRDVLAPEESQPVLGRVRRLIRSADGVALVLTTSGWWGGWLGGWSGLGSRPVAVPLSAVALLGADVVLVGLTPAQLAALPSLAGDAGEVLPADTVVRVGLTRPAH